MVDVVGHVDVSETVTCKQCGSVLRFLPHEAQYNSLKTRVGHTAWRYVICPSCQHKVRID